MRIRTLISGIIGLTIILSVYFATSATSTTQQIKPEPQGHQASIKSDEWHEFTSEEGRFSVMLPGTPKFSQTIKDTSIGDLEENNYSLKKKNIDFSIEYLDLPILSRIIGLKNIFKRSKNGLLEEEKGEELSFVSIKQDGLRGAELIYETRRQKGKARFFLKRNRLYVLVVSIQKKSDDDIVMDKFLNSFKVFKIMHKPHKYRKD